MFYGVGGRGKGRVGTQGKVMGVDISNGMLQLASRRATQDGQQDKLLYDEIAGKKLLLAQRHETPTL